MTQNTFISCFGDSGFKITKHDMKHKKLVLTIIRCQLIIPGAVPRIMIRRNVLSIITYVTLDVIQIRLSYLCELVESKTLARVNDIVLKGIIGQKGIFKKLIHSWKV